MYRYDSFRTEEKLRVEKDILKYHIVTETWYFSVVLKLSQEYCLDQ